MQQIVSRPKAMAVPKRSHVDCRIGRPIPKHVRDWYDAEYMKLCIGALAKAKGDPCIVLCSDYKVGNDEFGSETEYKLQILSDQLVALVAGSPGRAKKLSGYYRIHLANEVLDPTTIVEQLRPPIERLRKRLADTYLSYRLGITFDEFLAKGPTWFGHKDYKRRLAVIEDNKLKVDLIFAGFIGEVLILVKLQDEELTAETNFSLIGTGAYTAEPALHARKQTNQTQMVQAIYNVYEAKELGERSPHVGEQSRMFLTRPSVSGAKNFDAAHVSLVGEEFLAKMFSEFGPKEITEPYNLPHGSLLPAAH